MNPEYTHRPEDMGPGVSLVEVCPTCRGADADCWRCDGYGVVDVEPETEEGIDGF